MALVFLMGDETPFHVEENREEVLAALHDVGWASVVHLTLVGEERRCVTVRAPLIGAVADDAPKTAPTTLHYSEPSEPDAA